MNHSPSLFSRRNFLGAAAGVIATSKLLHAQGPTTTPTPSQGLPDRRSTVSLARGNSRRENICQSLLAIEDQILPVLKTKKCVVIKPNIVNTANQLASTNVDALQGILDFLAPRIKQCNIKQSTRK